jgi:hypothetical protein
MTEMLIGFAYWVAFLLVLEPGNVMRAHNAGHDLLIDREILRICAAAMLGAMATPAALWLSRRFFPGSARQLRCTLILIGGMSGLSFLLITMSCVLAAWVFGREWLPGLEDIGRTLAGNGLLVLFALLAFAALERAMRRHAEVEKPSADAVLRYVMIKAQGRQFRLDLTRVERIETQGNYLALYSGASTHLIRDTMASLSARLDPERFVRIHRRYIVATDLIVHVESYENGDGVAHLKDGSELKISRNYRKALLARWAAS